MGYVAGPSNIILMGSVVAMVIIILMGSVARMVIIIPRGNVARRAGKLLIQVSGGEKTSSVARKIITFLKVTKS